MDVAHWWALRELDSIKTYCLQDVRLTYGVYCCLTYQEPPKGKRQPGSEVVALGESA